MDKQPSEDTVMFFGRKLRKSNLIRLAGLVAFFLIVIVVLILVWPIMGRIFSQGPEELVKEVRSAGAMGVLVLLGMQFLQIIVAFIPGEVVQIAAGMMYGPWLGTLIILVGCVLSSFIIYQLVHRLGQPFVEDMVSTEHLEKFRQFEKSGKLITIVFILFLIPGMPKDAFTYIVSLTNIPVKTFLTVTTIARTPGVFMSAYAASGFMEGNITSSIIILVVLGLIALLAIIFRDKIFALVRGNQEDE